jgi:hypothetical protein
LIHVVSAFSALQCFSSTKGVRDAFSTPSTGGAGAIVTREVVSCQWSVNSKALTAEDAKVAEKIKFELFSVWFDVFAHSAIFAVKAFELTGHWPLTIGN